MIASSLRLGGFNGTWGPGAALDRKRTRLEDESFKWMLKNMSMLYVGCAVLILQDLSYLSRFW